MAKLWKEANPSTTLALNRLFSKPNCPWEWLSESPILLFHPLMVLGNLHGTALSPSGFLARGHGGITWGIWQSEPHHSFAVCLQGGWRVRDFMVTFLSHCSWMLLQRGKP